MAGPDSIASELVSALNARDYAVVAALAGEDIAIAGIGDGSEMGRDALRDRLARHFATFDESFGDAVVMRADGGSPVAIRVTARGTNKSGKSFSAEKVILLEIEEGLITRLSLLADASDVNRQLAG